VGKRRGGERGSGREEEGMTGSGGEGRNDARRKTTKNANLTNFWATVCYRTVVLFVRLSCPVLSVTLVYCGQTVGRIKTKLSKQVGLCPGHNVLDGAQVSLPQRGIAPNFRPKSVVAYWLD